ncbi:MAG: hypothetical protein QXQ68_07420, partial [Candidatus Nitrosocaldaceae archaeon]
QINEQLYLAGKINFQEYAKNLYYYSQIERQPTTTTTTAYVGMYRPHNARTGALSEIEYYEHTGFKLGEDYRQTKTELVQSLGVSESDIKLTKKEEEDIVAHYLKARYPWSSEKEREASIRETSLLAEKGVLRRQFEVSNLGISESTLQEYIDIKRTRPEITFPEFAYEKTIGSKSEIEKFSLGLFSQQALGFYQLGKHLNIKNEYLDLLSIAQQYKPAIEHDVVHAFVPFKKGDVAFNVGVGTGLAIDIVTLKGVVSSAIKYAKTPTTFVAFGSELRTGKFPTFRDITVHARKIGKVEYVRQSVNPLNIPATVKATIKDIKATLKGEVLEREISKVTKNVRAHITETLESAPIARTPTPKVKVEVSKQPIMRVDTEKGLVKTNILLGPLKEAKKDIEARLEDVKSTVREIRQSSTNNIYQPTKPLRELPSINLPKYSLRKETTTTKTALSNVSTEEIKALKRELKLDIERASFRVDEPKPVQAKEPTLTPSSPTPPSEVSLPKPPDVVVQTKTNKSVLTTLDKEIQKIHEQMNMIRRRYKIETEYDIVRYPPFAKINIPRLPYSMPRTNIDVRAEMRQFESMRRRLGITSSTTTIPDTVPRFRIDEGQRTRDTPRDTPITTPTIPAPPKPTETDTTITTIREIYIPKFTRSTKVESLSAVKLEPIKLTTMKANLKLDIPPMRFGASYPKLPNVRTTSALKFPRKKKIQTEIFTYRLTLPF